MEISKEEKIKIIQERICGRGEAENKPIGHRLAEFLYEVMDRLDDHDREIDNLWHK
jgi:hypothetical protein